MCKQGAGPVAKPKKVVGMGSCGVDYLASVAAYPKPDDKLRTEQLEVRQVTTARHRPCHVILRLFLPRPGSTNTLQWGQARPGPMATQPHTLHSAVNVHAVGVVPCVEGTAQL